MELKHVKRWKLPDCYFGTQWPDYYSSGIGQSRDSDELEESNFAAMLAALGGESDTVIVVRESHWAVGWVEWIAIHESDTRALAIADAQLERLESYPVLDEEDWSNREEDSKQEAWRNSSLRDRIELLAEYGHSIFAARRADYPGDLDDNGGIGERLLGH